MRNARTAGDTGNGESLAVASASAGLAIVLGAALVPLRSTLGPTNVALLMTTLVVIAAVAGGRIAGVASAVSASVTFNFFFTKPYLTLRVGDGHDIVTIVLIVLIGLAVGQLTSVRARRTSEVRDHVNALHGLEAVSAAVSAGVDPREVVATIHRELVDGAGLSDARFEPLTEDDQRPLVDRTGHMHTLRRTHTGRGFALPPEGARLPVASGDQPFGQLVIEAAQGVTVTVEQRKAIVAMADQLAMSIRQHPELAGAGMTGVS
jgi:K+-sensing histidine kinase KdpD